jgi:lipoate---protein ligase
LHPGQLFDVESFRQEPRRLAQQREATRSTVVLGSTQAMDLLDGERVHQSGVEVLRRRGGGGTVLLQSGDHLWIDAWVPRDDPLWNVDVSAAAAWVAAWWIAALEGLGLHDFEAHAGRAAPGAWGELVCFAGRGPGEVFHHGRKVMGLSQWRSREGALFSTCAYTHWDPEPLIELMQVDDTARAGLVQDLPLTGIGVSELEGGPADLSALRTALLSTFSEWVGTD